MGNKTRITRRYSMKTLGRWMFAMLLTLAVGFALTPAAVYAQDQEAASQQEEAVPEEQPRLIQVTVLGMSCPFCAYGVEQKLKKLEGVEGLTVVLATGLATLLLEEGADVSNDVLRKTVKDAGFEAAKVSRNFESEYPEYDSEEES
jgi:copper chaperone CopZ